MNKLTLYFIFAQAHYFIPVNASSPASPPLYVDNLAPTTTLHPRENQVCASDNGNTLADIVFFSRAFSPLSLSAPISSCLPKPDIGGSSINRAAGTLSLRVKLKPCEHLLCKHHHERARENDHHHHRPTRGPPVGESTSSEGFDSKKRCEAHNTNNVMGFTLILPI